MCVMLYTLMDLNALDIYKHYLKIWENVGICLDNLL